MKVGIVVDGDSELWSLPDQLDKLGPGTGHAYLRVVKAVIQPFAPAGSNARACARRLNLLRSKGADAIVVLIDRESAETCPGDIAGALQNAIRAVTGIEVTVVIKDRSYENWLVADPAALRAQPASFRVTKGDIAKIVPDLADNAPAKALIRKMVQGSCQKLEDSKRIMARADPATIGRNSRSFREFLQAVGHGAYASQTVRPVR